MTEHHVWAGFRANAAVRRQAMENPVRNYDMGAWSPKKTAQAVNQLETLRAAAGVKGKATAAEVGQFFDLFVQLNRESSSNLLSRSPRGVRRAFLRSMYRYQGLHEANREAVLSQRLYPVARGMEMQTLLLGYMINTHGALHAVGGSLPALSGHLMVSNALGIPLTQQTGSTTQSHHFMRLM